MDTVLKIRRAAKDDINGIMGLLAQVIDIHHKGRPDLFRLSSGKYTVNELKSILEDSNRPVFVTVDDSGSVVGYSFCIFQQHLNNNILTDIKTLYIDDLCVDGKCRGKRVGTALYEYVSDFARKSGCYNLTLNVWACNESAIRFYEALGLRPQKIGMEMIL